MNMRLAGTSETAELTGLSVDTLREWTVRRALIPADVPPRAKGSPAQFHWHTVLILQVATCMRNRFHIELQANRSLFSALRDAFAQVDPGFLEDRTLLIKGGNNWALVDNAMPLHTEALSIPLQPFIMTLAAFFGFGTAASEQIELFPTPASPSFERKQTRGSGVHELRKVVAA